MNQLQLFEPEIDETILLKDKDFSYTHPEILACAREGLDHQPFWDLASDEVANSRVMAANYFSPEYSFLKEWDTEDWQRAFWCNPPWSKLKEFALIIAACYDAIGGLGLNGYFLGTNDPTTAWFQLMSDRASQVMFSKSRKHCKFWQPKEGRYKDVSRGLVVFAFGHASVYPWVELMNIYHPVNYRQLVVKDSETREVFVR